MYILEVSYGCPSDKYPLNGLFQLDQAKALSVYGHEVVFAAVDMRSIRRLRKFGFSTNTVAGLPVYEFNFPIGPIFQKTSKIIAAFGFSHLLAEICRERGKLYLYAVGDHCFGVLKKPQEFLSLDNNCGVFKC